MRAPRSRRRLTTPPPPIDEQDSKLKNKKSLEKTLDKKQILCYNKDVPRGDKELTLRWGSPSVNGEQYAWNSKALHPLEKTLDIFHKMW